MDLESQHLLREGEDSIDGRPQQRILPRGACFFVAVVFGICFYSIYSGPRAHNEKAATISLRGGGFMQKVRRHTETVQLLFPSHAVTKVVKAQEKHGGRKEGWNKAKTHKHIRNESVKEAKTHKHSRNESVKEALQALNTSDAKTHKHIRNESVKEAKTHKHIRNESVKEVSTTTTRATLTTTEAIQHIYNPTKPPWRKVHKLGGLETITFLKKGEEQGMRALDTVQGMILNVTNRTQNSLEFK